MNYISAEKLFVQFGDKPLFEDLSFGLDKGDKIALIANNGKGKSTLLKILAGKDSPNAGQITVREGVKISLLEQEPVFNENQTIKELIRESNSEILKIIKAYEKAAEDQANDFNSRSHEAFEKASHAMDNNQAWDYERRLKQILNKFNITDLSQQIGKLSGGQKKRLALSLVLLDSPDVLLLDEPTNHLDVDMVEWLETYLSQSNITFFIVTHDRYFLDNVCTRIIEMEDEKIYHHKGNYSFYLKKKAEREIQFETEVNKAGRLAKKELEWMRTMPKARTTKSKSRIDAFYEVEKIAKSGKVKKEIKLDAKISRIGGKILELKNVYKSYGNIIILKGFEYTFRKGDRLGIVGKNGVGKSTFLNIITGKELADAGEINPGETIVYGYYTQGGLQFDEEKKVIDIVKDEAEVFLLASGNTISASQFLEHFMFPPKVQQTPVSKLSGGEKRRLYLLTVLIKNPNFLIFDEPTNDLDLETLQKLEEFLADFPGCLIVVSHDRYFMDKLTDHLFIFKGDGVVSDFHGSYTNWRQKQTKTEKAEKTKEKITASKTEKKEKKKLSYMEKREYQQLEKDIELLEEEKKKLEIDMETFASDAGKTVELVERYGAVEKELDEKENRWLELAEFID